MCFIRKLILIHDPRIPTRNPPIEKTKKKFSLFKDRHENSVIPDIVKQPSPINRFDQDQQRKKTTGIISSSEFHSIYVNSPCNIIQRV